MKYSLYGFMTIADLIDNRNNTDSPLGELSDEVRTYALDKGAYTKDEYPDVRLISFRSREDEQDVEVPLFVRDLCIKLGDWCFKRAEDGTLNLNAAAARQAIVAEFGDQLDLGKLGKMTSAKGMFLPQFIEFSLKDKTQYSDSIVKIWFSDPALKQQYPFYDIVVVPLIDNIDDFFLPAPQVRAIRDNIDLAKLHDKTNVMRGRSPYTLIKSYNYNWNGEGNDKIPMPWTVIIYGPIGNNIDLIREALAKWILAHSNHSREDWERIFPDIFIPTEYMIAPFWTLPSVPGFRVIAAMYSPSIPYKDIIPFAKEAMVGYKEDHLEQNLIVSSSLYKSLSFAVCGHKQNRLAPVNFYEHMPQYALIRSRTDDFNRLDTKHQDFVELLNELFIIAENADDDADVGLGVTRVVRDNITYYAKTLNNIQYLVVARSNYLKGTLRGITPPASQ